MPNWCQNTLEIRGDKDAILRFIEAAKNDEQPISLERLLPTPEDLVEDDGWYDWRVEHWGTKWDLDFCETGNAVHIINDGADIAKSVTSDGEPSESGGAGNRTMIWGLGHGALLSAYFLTAWAPPIPGFNAIVASFPDLIFTLTFGEAGGGFAGRCRWLQGRMVEDVDLSLESVLSEDQMWF